MVCECSQEGVRLDPYGTYIEAPMVLRMAWMRILQVKRKSSADIG